MRIVDECAEPCRKNLKKAGQSDHLACHCCVLMSACVMSWEPRVTDVVTGQKNTVYLRVVVIFGISKWTVIEQSKEMIDDC